MRIVELNGKYSITVEFQDEYKAKVHTQYCNFSKGVVKNPYYPAVYGIGIAGSKYKTVDENSESTREYMTWYHIIQRCFSNKFKKKQPAYTDITCCDEWLQYENFYEWLHSQSNFDKWYTGKRWAIDKDILVKGSKIYSPETCCLIPQNVNCLFLKREAKRGLYPIGVRKNKHGFSAICHNPIIDRSEELGCYSTQEEAFNAYKMRKEEIIKQIAQTEYDSQNITKECYEAMMNYEVEITD